MMKRTELPLRTRPIDMLVSQWLYRCRSGSVRRARWPLVYRLQTNDGEGVLGRRVLPTWVAPSLLIVPL